MKNQRTAFRIALCLIISLAMLSPATTIYAQTADDNWTRLNTLQLGTKIEIETIGGKRIKARFRSVTESLLTLSKDKRTLELSRNEVKNIYRIERGGAGRGAVIGAAIGGGTGAAIGVIGVAAQDGDDDGASVIAALFLGGIGTGIGALTGALIKGKSKKILIYEAR